MKIIPGSIRWEICWYLYTLVLRGDTEDNKNNKIFISLHQSGLLVCITNRQQHQAKVYFTFLTQHKNKSFLHQEYNQEEQMMMNTIAVVISSSTLLHSISSPAKQQICVANHVSGSVVSQVSRDKLSAEPVWWDQDITGDITPVHPPCHELHCHQPSRMMGDCLNKILLQMFITTSCLKLIRIKYYTAHTFRKFSWTGKYLAKLVGLLPQWLILHPWREGGYISNITQHQVC